MRSRSCRPDDAPIRARLRELAAERRRFGFRRFGILLSREGMVMKRKKLLRLYREEKLAVRPRRGRKRALGSRAPMAIPQGPNQRWSLDFLSDAFTDGRRFRIFAVVDDFTRECLALVADTSLSGVRIARELDVLVARRGKPLMIVSDGARIIGWNGTTSHRESPCRTASSRASTASSAMNASTRRCFARSAMPRPTLPSPPISGITGRQDSTSDRDQSGEQVTTSGTKRWSQSEKLARNCAGRGRKVRFCAGLRSLG